MYGYVDNASLKLSIVDKKGFEESKDGILDGLELQPDPVRRTLPSAAFSVQTMLPFPSSVRLAQRFPFKSTSEFFCIDAFIVPKY